MATIQDIANELGISKTAVSRILNHKGSFSAETIHKVEACAKRLNYVSAGMLRNEEGSDFKIVAAVLPLANSPYYGILTACLEQAVYKYGYSLLVCGSSFDKGKEEEIVKYTKERTVKGLLIAGFTYDISSLDRDGIPAVSIGLKLADHIPSVTTDNYMAGVLAARHLMTRKCRKYLYISNYINGRKYDKRYIGFKEELAKHNHEVRDYFLQVDSRQYGSVKSTVTQMILENPDADAVFAESQSLVNMCIQVYSELGYNIPEDVKIIGYSTNAMAGYCYPRPAYIRENVELIAQKAAAMLADMIENGSTEGKDIVIPVSIEQGSTS